MLKRLALLAVAFSLLPASYAMAMGYGDGPGCGWGSMLFQGNKKIVHQVLAATTNGTFGNQTFGITTGTAGCTNDGLVKNDEKVNAFAAVNLDSLSQEMAQGQGEHLTSLAVLMGVPTEHQPAFFTMTQENYTSLFPSEKTTSTDMLATLRHQLESHQDLLASR